MARDYKVWIRNAVFIRRIWKTPSKVLQGLVANIGAIGYGKDLSRTIALSYSDFWNMNDADDGNPAIEMLWSLLIQQ